MPNNLLRAIDVNIRTINNYRNIKLDSHRITFFILKRISIRFLQIHRIRTINYFLISDKNLSRCLRKNLDRIVNITFHTFLYIVFIKVNKLRFHQIWVCINNTSTNYRCIQRILLSFFHCRRNNEILLRS